MRQVPKNTTELVYGIIGSGRVANHMSRYFGLLGAKYLRWSRSLNKFHSQHKVNKLFELIEKSDILIVLISDDSLESFIKKNLSSTKKQIVHFSGSQSIKGTFGAHPLMTFTDQVEELGFYQSIPFVCEKSDKITFNEIFPKLENIVFEICKDKKPLYHALCVMGGNFTTLLWLKVFEDFEKKLKLPREIAFPFLLQTCKNLQRFEDPLTGPFSRKDKKTISKNFESLKDDQFAEIYKSFAKTFVPEFKLEEQ